MNFDNIASDINDISVSLLESGRVLISVLGDELKTLSMDDYQAIIK